MNDPESQKKQPDSEEQKRIFYIENPIGDIFNHSNPSFDKRRDEMIQDYSLATSSLQLIAPNEIL